MLSAQIDTIHIGATRSLKSLDDYFTKTYDKANLYILIDEGTYYSNGTWISGKNITLEGQGVVNLYCTELGENVMWVMGENITVRNIRMKHFAPGTGYNQNCSGRVIAFDHATHALIENCDLNGCGLAGLHDNIGNADILIKNNYIHNNSLGAYTDINGGVWLEEVDDHPVFKFENNRMTNNGEDRVMEFDSIDDYIIRCPDSLKKELSVLLSTKIENWEALPNPFIAAYKVDYFEDAAGKTYNFEFGNNDYEMLIALEELEHKYLNKPCKIYWAWEPSTFSCCNRPYEYVEAYMPSIVNVELVE